MNQLFLSLRDRCWTVQRGDDHQAGCKVTQHLPTDFFSESNRQLPSTVCFH